jgi:hypothetical protein
MKTKWYVFFSLFMLAGCSKSNTLGLAEGNIYCMPVGDGTYLIAKVVKIDTLGPHMKAYSNILPAVPKKIDESKLISPQKSGDVGARDMAILFSSFEKMHCIFIQKSTVKDEELTAYREWIKSGDMHL